MKRPITSFVVIGLAVAFALPGAALAAGKGKTAGPDTNSATGIGQDDSLLPPGQGGTPPGQAKKNVPTSDGSEGREEGTTGSPPGSGGDGGGNTPPNNDGTRDDAGTEPPPPDDEGNTGPDGRPLD